MNFSIQATSLLNITSESTALDHQQWYVGMLLLSSILISVPNAVILICIFRMSVLRRQAANHFIASFALSDLLTGAVLFPLGIIHEIEYVQRHRYETAVKTMIKHLNVSMHVMNPMTMDDIGEGFCDILQTLINFMAFVSLWHMTLIAMDRYYRITFPIVYKSCMTRTKAWLSCLFVWCLAALVSLFFYWDYKRTGIKYQPTQCLVYIVSGLESYIFALVVGFGPMMLMIYYYVKLLFLSRYNFKSNIPVQIPRTSSQDRQQNQCIPMSSRGRSCFARRPQSTSSDSEAVEDSELRSESEIMEIKARKKRCRRSKRAAILIGLIIVGHTTFVLPTTTLYLLYTFVPKLMIQDKAVFSLYPWMMFFNSAFNPCIYFFTTKELRQSLGLWFRKKFHRCFSHNTVADVDCP